MIMEEVQVLNREEDQQGQLLLIQMPVDQRHLTMEDVHLVSPESLTTVSQQVLPTAKSTALVVLFGMVWAASLAQETVVQVSAHQDGPGMAATATSTTITTTTMMMRKIEDKGQEETILTMIDVQWVGLGTMPQDVYRQEEIEVHDSCNYSRMLLLMRSDKL